MDKKQLIGKINKIRDEINQSFEKQFIDFDKIESELYSIVVELEESLESDSNLLKANQDKQTIIKRSVITSDYI